MGCHRLSDETVLVIRVGDIQRFHGFGTSAVVVSNDKKLSGLKSETVAAAGPKLIEYCSSLGTTKVKKARAKCHTGEAVITPAFCLAASHLVHTVVPHKDLEAARFYLTQCFRNCLNIARENGVKSIAFPALGATEFPVDEIAQVALLEIQKNHEGFQLIYIFLDKEQDRKKWVAVAAAVGIPYDGEGSVPVIGGSDRSCVSGGGASSSGRVAPATALAATGAAPELAIVCFGAVTRWPVPARFLSMRIPEFLCQEEFRALRKISLCKFGISETLLTATVQPTSFRRETLRELIDAKGFIRLEPRPSSQGLREHLGIEAKAPGEEMQQLMLAVNDLKKSQEESRKSLEEHSGRLTHLELEVARLKGKDALMARKLIDKTREKARAHLAAKGIQSPDDWNSVTVDPACIQSLRVAGLTREALELTQCGRSTLQELGDKEVYEPPSDYLQMIEKHSGEATHTPLLDTFEYYFGIPAPRK